MALSDRRWDAIWQRPQQLLTRLCTHYRVLFIEAPRQTSNGNGTLCDDAAPVRLERISRGPDLALLVPHLAGTGNRFDATTCARLAPALATFLHAAAITNPIVWVDTPSAWPLLAALKPRRVVCDGRDDSSDPGDPGDAGAALLQRADLVLTSGPALHAAMRVALPRVSTPHLVANAVDAVHFDPAGLDPHSHDGRETRTLLASFATCPGPRLGYAGAINARLDIDLLAQLADARPQWQFVLVGPVSEIDPARLPLRANLHWLGPQPYSRLPHLYASWDVCLLPLAMHASTRCANPLQPLEALAAGKPVVSTPLPDTVALHGATVQFGSTAAALLAACEQALAQTPAARDERIRRGAGVLRANRWDARADEVLALLHATLAAAPAHAPAPTST